MKKYKMNKNVKQMKENSSFFFQNPISLFVFKVDLLGEFFD